MLVSFEYLPCRVRFAEDPSELVFDYRLPIRSNIDHILGDEENLTRIPASLMGEGNSLLLRRAFEGAVAEAARRAAANYTLTVPQFYGGRIQLLLPLCLTGDKPELARETIAMIRPFQDRAYERFGRHTFQMSDEFYLDAGIDLSLIHI